MDTKGRKWHTTIYLNYDIKALLFKLAKAESRTMTSIIVEALRNYAQDRSVGVNEDEIKEARNAKFNEVNA